MSAKRKISSTSVNLPKKQKTEKDLTPPQYKNHHSYINPHNHPELFDFLSEEEIQNLSTHNINKIYKDKPNIALNIKKHRRRVSNINSARKCKFKKDQYYDKLQKEHHKMQIKIEKMQKTYEKMQQFIEMMKVENSKLGTINYTLIENNKLLKERLEYYENPFGELPTFLK